MERADWKIKIRYFNTHLIISSYMKETSLAVCQRNWGKNWDHAHIFWDCPIIHGFWGGIKNEIDNIMKVDIPLDPFIFLLQVIPKDRYSTDQRYTLRILLLIAKKMITLKLMV